MGFRPFLSSTASRIDVRTWEHNQAMVAPLLAAQAGTAPGGAVVFIYVGADHEFCTLECAVAACRRCSTTSRG